MKKKTIRRLALILIVSMLLFTVAFAAEESSAYIGAMNGYITFSGNNVNVYFSVVGRHIMDEIGVSEIRLFEQNGNTWTKVYTFESDDPAYTADMLSYNTSAKADHVTYSGDSTKNYFAVLYFYAADSNGSDTITYYT
jgi:hypothetical protein